ncbi:MAG: hypothetical protein ACRCX5_13315 [Bacteroidales bacterium]
MALTNTGATSVKFYSPSHILITPYTGASKGAKVYDIQNILEGTTSVTQDDNTETPVKEERGGTIVNNVQLGSYKFACEIGDMQADLLKDLVGFSVDSTSSKVYAPSSYKEVFAEVAIVCETGGKKVAAILPKVQLNSKLIIDSINSSVGRISINGTGFNIIVQDGSNSHEAPFYLDPNYSIPS